MSYTRTRFNPSTLLSSGRPTSARSPEFFGAAGSQSPEGIARPTQEVLAWIGAQARAAGTSVSEGSRLEVVMARLPIHQWPERRLLVTAIDTEDRLARDLGPNFGCPVAAGRRFEL